MFGFGAGYGLRDQEVVLDFRDCVLGLRPGVLQQHAVPTLNPHNFSGLPENPIPPNSGIYLKT